MKPIRNSAKAVIIQEGKLLLTKNQDEQGFFIYFQVVVKSLARN